MSTCERPVYEIRLSRIRALVWAHRSSGNRAWYSVTIVRRYREGTEWKDAMSFSRDDLPLVVKAAELAYAWIWKATMNEDHSNGN